MRDKRYKRLFKIMNELNFAANEVEDKENDADLLIESARKVIKQFVIDTEHDIVQGKFTKYIAIVDKEDIEEFRILLSRYCRLYIDEDKEV